MPHELAGLMIKGAKTDLRPAIHAFHLSATSSLSRDLLDEVKTAFPEALTEDERGALLAPGQAVSMLERWQQLAGEHRLYLLDSILEEFPALIALARNGHSMVLHSE